MIRTTRPTKGNKYFIRKANGGYSTCIQGKPTDKQCNVLANCVGYACGAFNEELGLKYEKYHLNCNAENFIERAIASGLSIVKKPVVGSIIVWQGKGNLAGHVGIVTEVINSNCIKVAQSGYGSKAFWIATHYNNNGRWGLNANYPLRGFIVNPEVSKKPTSNDKPVSKPSKEKVLTIDTGVGVYGRIGGIGFSKPRIAYKKGTVIKKVTMNVGSANGYKWFKGYVNNKLMYFPYNKKWYK